MLYIFIILYKIIRSLIAFACVIMTGAKQFGVDFFFYFERMVTMKKLFAFLLAAMIGISLTACGKDSGKTDPGKAVSDSDAIVGGWTSPESVAITDDVKAVLEKAASEMVGATYEPVAYLGSQVVAGTNHRILCKLTPAAEKAGSTYAIVTVYENLEGKAEITEILNSEAKVYVSDEVLDGGWSAPETPALTEEAKTALENAVSGLAGAAYKPVALLGTQVVAGTNYCLLCEVTPVVENPEAKYAVVYVSEDLEGKATLGDIFEFAAAE